VLSSVAARLARLDTQLTDAERDQVRQASGGMDLKARWPAASCRRCGPMTKTSPQEQEAALRQAVMPLANPALRQLILGLKASKDLVIDTVTQDRVIEAGFSEAARERAQGIVQSFEAFIAQHKDEITALQILYSRPVQGAAELRRPEGPGRRAARAAAPAGRKCAVAGLCGAGQEQGEGKVLGRQRILTDLVSTGALCDAAGQRTGAVPRARGGATTRPGWRSSRVQPARPSRRSSCAGWR
jgi:type I restriction enzyme R subunit